MLAVTSGSSGARSKLAVHLMRGAAGGAAVGRLVAEGAGETRAAVADGSVGRVATRAAVEAGPRRAVARRRHGGRHRHVAARARPAALALAAESRRLPKPWRYARDRPSRRSNALTSSYCLFFNKGYSSTTLRRKQRRSRSTAKAQAASTHEVLASLGVPAGSGGAALRRGRGGGRGRLEVGQRLAGGQRRAARLAVHACRSRTSARAELGLAPSRSPSPSRARRCPRGAQTITH